MKSSDKYFKEIVLEENMINSHFGKDIILIEETPYASGNPSVSYIDLYENYIEKTTFLLSPSKSVICYFFQYILSHIELSMTGPESTITRSPH